MLNNPRKSKSIFEVVEKLPLTKGTKFTLENNENFTITTTSNGPELLVTKVETKSFGPDSPPIPQQTTDQVSSEDQRQEKLKKLQEEQQDEELKKQFQFQNKWQLRPGFWYLHDEYGLLSLEAENELYFETRTSKKLLDILRVFFKNHHKMLKYKKMKRAYLLHSDPGMGKSALIRYFCREALKNPQVCVLKVSGELNFGKLHHIFMMDYHIDTKYVILVIEDFGKKDYSHNSNLYNPSCLNFLDGDVQLFKVPTLILTTTNFAKQLGNFLTNRPGRFNQIIKVLPPSDEEVYELVQYYLDRPLQEEEKLALAGKQLTPDHCLEVVIRSDLEEVSIASATEEILKERQGIVDWNSDS